MQRSQHLTQEDTRVFGQSYVANCSSVDGQAAFLGEPAEHRHIEYFQGLERFREAGLPCALPAELKSKLCHDEQLRALEDNVAASPSYEAKRRLNEYRRKLRDGALRRFQRDWVQNQRDWKILTKGKESARTACTANLFQNLCLLRPERGRLAKMIACDTPLSQADMWQAMRDLYSLCTGEFTVCFLPGHDPIKGACPVRYCQLRLARYVFL